MSEKVIIDKATTRKEYEVSKSKILPQLYQPLQDITNAWQNYIIDKLDSLTLESLKSLKFTITEFRDRSAFLYHPELPNLIKTVGLEMYYADRVRALMQAPINLNLPFRADDSPNIELIYFFITTRNLSIDFFKENPQCNNALFNLPGNPSHHIALPEGDFLMEDNIVTLFDIIALSCYGHLNDPLYVISVFSMLNRKKEHQKTNALQQFSDAPLNLYANLRFSGCCPVMVIKSDLGIFEVNPKYLEFLQKSKSKLGENYPYHGGCPGFAAIPAFGDTALSIFLKIHELCKLSDTQYLST